MPEHCSKLPYSYSVCIAWSLPIPYVILPETRAVLHHYSYVDFFTVIVPSCLDPTNKTPELHYLISTDNYNLFQSVRLNY